VARPQGKRPAAVFYPFGNPKPCASAFPHSGASPVADDAGLAALRREIDAIDANLFKGSAEEMDASDDNNNASGGEPTAGDGE
jgi:hypothetical protein